MNISASKSNMNLKINYRDLMIFIVPVLIFLLYLFVYNPGVLTVASYSQLHQIATGKFTTTSPIFHSLIVTIFLKLFGSPFYIGLFQILIFSVMWMAICKYHRDDHAKGSTQFVVQFVITLLICLIPINAVYSITLSSNVLFSYSLVFLCFLIKVMLDKDGHIDKKLAIIMALTLAIMSGLNNYGMLIAIPSLIAITYYLFKKGNSENTYVTLIGLAVLCIFLIASLNFVYDVQKDIYNIQTNDAFDESINIKTAQNQFFSTINGEPSESYETMNAPNYGNNKFDMINSYVNLWKENFIFSILNNPILYLMLSVLLLAFIYLRTESEIFLVYVPTFLNFAVAVLTGQNNQYPCILTFYLILIIFVSFYFNVNLKAGTTTNIRPTTTNLGRVESAPKIEETYENDNYFSSLESEIENLTLDDINEMLRETQSEEIPKQEIPMEEPLREEPPEIKQSIQQGDSDLLDEILKEIEMEKKQ